MTAYEMRSSDWSSDVCSSELNQWSDQPFDERQDAADAHLDERSRNDDTEDRGHDRFDRRALLDHDRAARDQRTDKIEAGGLHDEQAGAQSSAEGRAGTEGGRTCRLRGSPKP